MLQHQPRRCLLSMSQRDPMGTDVRRMKFLADTQPNGHASAGSGGGVNHAIPERRAVYRCATRQLQENSRRSPKRHPGWVVSARWIAMVAGGAIEFLSEPG